MQYGEFILCMLFIAATFSFFSLAPWVPTKGTDLKRIDDILGLRSGERFLEMGCGTAKVSIYIARNNPEATIIGVELSPFLYIISKAKVLLSGLKNIEIKYGNALKLDLKKFDAIYVFGLPDTITYKVFPMIANIQNKDFRFVSYCFKTGNDHFKEIRHPMQKEYTIYEYIPFTSSIL